MEMWGMPSSHDVWDVISQGSLKAGRHKRLACGVIMQEMIGYKIANILIYFIAVASLKVAAGDAKF
eukprot:15358836-Ditylum_brightwellii.AAC.3